MKKYCLLSILTGLFFFLSGCRDSSPTTPRRPALAPEAANVAVYDRMPPDCTPRGRIAGRAASAEAGEVVWKYALNDLRNQAAVRRATSVFMERYNHRTEGNLLVIEIVGVLLECAGEAQAGPETPGTDALTPPPAGANDDILPPPSGDPADDGIAPPPAGR